MVVIMRKIFETSFNESIICDEFGMHDKLCDIVDRNMYYEVRENISDKLQEKLFDPISDILYLVQSEIK